MSARITERWTTRSGIRIRYLDNDPTVAAGLPLLFVPGLTDFAEDYHALLEFFAPRRTLVVEVRGRGQSESPAHGYSVAEHLTDLRAVLDEAQLERVHVMTFSRGTSWSLELALTEPRRVASLSIGDYQAVEVGMDETFPDEQWGTRFRGRPIPERVQRHVLDGIQATSVHRSLWKDLGALGIPVLVAHGDQQGALVDAAAIDRYRANVPKVEIVAIPGAGHDLFRPDRLAYPRAVEAFLRGDFT